VFTRVEVQSLLDRDASLTHVATVLAPYSFEIRPLGFRVEDPNFRVLVERVAFRLRVTVVPDYLAVAVVAAVVSGAINNPARTDHLRSELEASGWTPEINLSAESFVVQATFDEVRALEGDALVEVAVQGGLALSEFVLDQLVITRPIGEMRQAVERPISDEPTADPWLYDPSERDRATQVHRSLENWLMASLRERGIEPLDPAGEPFFDLAWRVDDRFFVCEVKSTTNSEVHQLRLGLGQILQYAQLLKSSGLGDVEPVLLVEQEPRGGEWIALCARLSVTLLWPSQWETVAQSIAPTARLKP
jgi:hypothetical protein